MLTKFGIFTRKLRLDHAELLKDMAEKLDVSSSFLSAVENGKKKIPSQWIEKIADEYSLTKEQIRDFEFAVIETQETMDINMENLSQEKKELAFTFARQIDNFDDETVKKIREIFNVTGGVNG